MIKSLFTFIFNQFKSRTQLRLENLFLKKQLEMYNRSNKRISIKKSDRFFITLTRGLLNNWKENLINVKPETVIKWHREGFKLFWKRKSKWKGGRKRIDVEIRKLINQLTLESRSWGVPRIHGELLKLGFNNSQSTVYRYLQHTNRDKPSQN